MPPKVLCSAVQKRKLVEYMVANPLFANGEFGGPLGARKHEAEWQALAEALREIGPEKSVAAWKITWRDLKRKAREENAATRRATAVTVNTVAIPPVGEEEQMVLSVIGVESSDGVGPPESWIGDVVEAQLPQISGESANSPASSPVFNLPVDFWTPHHVAGPCRTSTYIDTATELTHHTARHFTPASHGFSARSAAPSSVRAPATAHALASAPARGPVPGPAPAPAPALAPVPAPARAPATTPAPALARAPAPAPANARTRTRIHTSEPAAFLQLQREHNDILKDILKELRKSNELRARHLETLQDKTRVMASRRYLEETQIIDDENLE